MTVARDPDLRAALLAPQLRLHGAVDADMLGAVLTAQTSDADDGPLVVELMTTGGDADCARRIALEIDRLRARTGRRLVFLGATLVYSAGMTIMAAFPREDRFLTPDTMLMVHERHMNRTVTLDGALLACEQTLSEICNEIRTGVDLERQGFRALIRGSSITIDEIIQKARFAWYIPAQEAKRLDLVAALFDPARD